VDESLGYFQHVPTAVGILLPCSMIVAFSFQMMALIGISMADTILHAVDSDSNPKHQRGT